MENACGFSSNLELRRYPEVGGGDPTEPLEPAQVVAMLKLASDRIMALTTGWLRVGFVQGNFNSDNCLAGGRTMDYGPFGFVEKFAPLWNMWSGGGEHFGFLNQPAAGAKNFGSLVSGCLPLLQHPKAAAHLVGDARPDRIPHTVPVTHCLQRPTTMLCASLS
jgi:uncharacterized protein YdiU (UPF0061 family)